MAIVAARATRCPAENMTVPGMLMLWTLRPE